MKNYKCKLTALMLALCTIFALTACGNSAENGKSNSDLSGKLGSKGEAIIYAYEPIESFTITSENNIMRICKLNYPNGQEEIIQEFKLEKDNEHPYDGIRWEIMYGESHSVRNNLQYRQSFDSSFTRVVATNGLSGMKSSERDFGWVDTDGNFTNIS